MSGSDSSPASTSSGQPNSTATSFNTSFSNCSVAVPISDDVLANAANIPEEEYFTRHPYREKCEHCDKEFETPASFHVHHPCFERSDFYLKNIQGHEDPNGLHYLCKFCNRRFFERHLLKQHIRYHLPDRPFECNFCGHRFVCRPEVVAHVSSFHLKLKPFTCKEPGCGKKYAEKFSLERHMDKNHGGKAFYRCKVCGEEFHWNSKWNKHKKTHPNYPEDEQTQPLDGNPLVCSFPGCEKKYSQKFMVGLHYEAVHLGKPRYKCDVCNKTFMFGQYLRDHKKRVGHFTESDGDIVVEGVNFMEGEDMDLLDGEDNLEDLEDGMIEYFEQEIQHELQSKHNPFEPKKNLAALLAEGPSSSYSNHTNFLEQSLTKRNSLLETALGTSASSPLMNQLSSSHAFQNTNYAKSQQQQHQQQMSFASFKSDPDSLPSSSMDNDSSLGDYYPSNFLEVILVENDEAELESDPRIASKNITNETKVKKERVPVKEEPIPGPDPSIPFTPKDILVCQVCEGRFLSSILFKKHTEDHPASIEDNRSSNVIEVLQPGKTTVTLPAFPVKKTAKSTAVVQPTIMSSTQAQQQPVLTLEESNHLETEGTTNDLTNGFHEESAERETAQDMQEINGLSGQEESAECQEEGKTEEVVEYVLSNNDEISTTTGEPNHKRRRMTSTSSSTEDHHQQSEGNNNVEVSSSNGSTNRDNCPLTPRRTSLRLTRVHHDYYKLTNPTIK